MKNFINEFWSNYGFMLVYAAVTALAAYVAAACKKFYEKKFNTDEKRKVVKECVLAVEQLYQAFSGAEKLEAAKTAIVQRLNDKGIPITDLEMDMMIESLVAEFNFNDLSVSNRAGIDCKDGDEAVG